MTPLKARIAAKIQTDGALSLNDYMAMALSDPDDGYYMQRVPFGAPTDAGGDFTTAPEVSQMFGELVGAWCIDLWDRMDRPSTVNLIELGPGRGTLMADMLRVAVQVPAFSAQLQVHFIETSPALREEQKKRVPKARWHETLDTLPPNVQHDDAVTLVIANEFFDALPITQHEYTGNGWREIAVDIENDELVYARTPPHAPAFSDVQTALLPTTMKSGDIIEASAGREKVMQQLSALLMRTRGAALIIDYGYSQPQTGDSFQAMRHHEFVHPLAEPGAADLTAHVNFAVLARIAANAGLHAHPTAQQGSFLRALGLDQRATQLANVTPEAGNKIMSERDRLAAPDQMGHLFKVLGVRHPDLPALAGFVANAPLEETPAEETL